MKNFYRGAKYSYPIVIGYLPIAISFGAVARAANLTPAISAFMSAMVFAGASQFIAVAMLVNNIGIVQIIFATLAVNLRHIVMSFSLLPKTRSIPLRHKIFLFMGITDETFAVLSLKDDPALKTTAGFAGLVVTSYLSWVAGTFIGASIVGFLSDELVKSLSVALYALFISLLVSSIYGNLKHLITISAAIAINILLSKAFSSSWALITSIALAPLLTAILFKNRKRSAR